MRIALQVVTLLVLLAILAGVVLAVFALANLMNAPQQVAGGIGGVTSQAGRALDQAQEAFTRATDPNRPPTGLTYDYEYTALHTWRLGEVLPQATDYVLTLRSIHRREGADTPDTALYAVIHAELRTPRETRVLGQVIRTDADPRDHMIYKGETFRIGRALYRVNWISQQEAALAAGVYRHPDAVKAPIRFAYD